MVRRPFQLGLTFFLSMQPPSNYIMSDDAHDVYKLVEDCEAEFMDVCSIFQRYIGAIV